MSANVETMFSVRETPWHGLGRIVMDAPASREALELAGLDWEYNPQTRRREKVGMEERTVEAASMFDVNKAIMRCLVKNLAMFGLGLYVYAGEDLPEDAAPQSDAEPKKQPKPKSTSQKQEKPPMPCICVRCNQPIKRVKLKDGSIMQAAEFAATHEGMCADCYKATRLNVA